jgi:hypothetical protein
MFLSCYVMLGLLFAGTYAGTSHHTQWLEAFSAALATPQTHQQLIRAKQAIPDPLQHHAAQQTWLCLAAARALTHYQFQQLQLAAASASSADVGTSRTPKAATTAGRSSWGGEVEFVKSELALVLARVERQRLGSEQEAAEAQQLLSMALMSTCRELSAAARSLLVGYQEQQVVEGGSALVSAERAQIKGSNEMLFNGVSSAELDHMQEPGQQQQEAEGGEGRDGKVDKGAVPEEVVGYSKDWDAAIGRLVCQLHGLGGVLQSLAVAGLADFMDPSTNSSSRGQGLPEAEPDLYQLLLEDEEGEEELWAAKRHGEERELRLREQREGWVSAGVGLLQQVQELHKAADHYALPGVLGWAAVACSDTVLNRDDRCRDKSTGDTPPAGDGDSGEVMAGAEGRVQLGILEEGLQGGRAAPEGLESLWEAAATLIRDCCGRMDEQVQEGCLLETRLAEQAAGASAASPRSGVAADVEDDEGGQYSFEALQQQWLALEESFAACLHEGLGVLLGIADVGVVSQLAQAMLQEEQPLLPMLQHWATEVGHLGWGSPQLHGAWGGVVLLLLSGACTACRQQQQEHQVEVGQLDEVQQGRESIGGGGGGGGGGSLQDTAAVTGVVGEAFAGEYEELPLDFGKYKHMVMTLRALKNLVLGPGLKGDGDRVGGATSSVTAVDGERSEALSVGEGSCAVAAAAAAGPSPHEQEEPPSPAAAQTPDTSGAGGRKSRRFRRRGHRKGSQEDAAMQLEHQAGAPVAIGQAAAAEVAVGGSEGGSGHSPAETLKVAVGGTSAQQLAAESPSVAGRLASGLHATLNKWLLQPALSKLQEQLQLRLQHLGELVLESQEVLARKQQYRQGEQLKQHRGLEEAVGSSGGQKAAAAAEHLAVAGVAAQSGGDEAGQLEQLDDGFGELVAFTDFDPSAPGADMLLEEELGGSTDEGCELGAELGALEGEEGEEEWLKQGGLCPDSESEEGVGAAGLPTGPGGNERELVAFTDFDPKLPGADVDLEGEGLLWDAPLEETGQEAAGRGELGFRKMADTAEGLGEGANVWDIGEEGLIGELEEEHRGQPGAATAAKVLLLSEDSEEVQELVRLLGALQLQLGQVQAQGHEREVQQGLLQLVQLLQEQWLHHLAAFEWLWEDVLEEMLVEGLSSSSQQDATASADAEASPTTSSVPPVAGDTTTASSFGVAAAGPGAASEAAWKLQLQSAVLDALTALGHSKGEQSELAQVLHSPGHAYQQYLGSPQQSNPATPTATGSGAGLGLVPEAERVSVQVPTRRQLLASWQSCVEGIGAVEDELLLWQEGCAAACIDLHRGLVAAAQQQAQLPANPDMCLKVGGQLGSMSVGLFHA